MAEQTFEQYVTEWADLVKQIDKLKAKLKPLTDREMLMRRSIFDSVNNAQKLAEGTNDFTLADGRVLKLKRSIKREVDESALAVAKEEYSKLNDITVAFDDLFRIKYEVDLRSLRKVEDSKVAMRALGKAITSKDSAPEVKLA